MSFPSGRRCFGHPHSLYAQAVRVVLVDPVRSLPPSLLRCRSSREICTVPMCALYPSSQWSILLFLFGSSFLAEALPPSFGFRSGYLPLPLSADARLLQVSSLVDDLPSLSCSLLSCRCFCCQGCFGPFSSRCFAAIAAGCSSRLIWGGRFVPPWSCLLCRQPLCRFSLFVWALRLEVPSPCLFFVLWFVSSCLPLS